MDQTREGQWLAYAEAGRASASARKRRGQLAPSPEDDYSPDPKRTSAVVPYTLARSQRQSFTSLF